MNDMERIEASTTIRQTTMSELEHNRKDRDSIFVWSKNWNELYLFYLAIDIMFKFIIFLV